jgi:hypothetical protein
MLDDDRGFNCYYSSFSSRRVTFHLITSRAHPKYITATQSLRHRFRFLHLFKIYEVQTFLELESLSALFLVPNFAKYTTKYATRDILFTFGLGSPNTMARSGQARMFKNRSRKSRIENPYIEILDHYSLISLYLANGCALSVSTLKFRGQFMQPWPFIIAFSIKPPCHFGAANTPRHRPITFKGERMRNDAIHTTINSD